MDNPGLLENGWAAEVCESLLGHLVAHPALAESWWDVESHHSKSYNIIIKLLIKKRLNQSLIIISRFVSRIC